MKKNTYTLSSLVLRYNKYRQKLIRLHKAGKNLSRQHVLKRHIERIYKQLSSTGFGVSRQAALSASFVAIMSLGSQANAQTQFREKHLNMFGLEPFTTGTYTIATPHHVDLDNDGDLDILCGHYDGDFRYFENTGTAMSPAYASPVTNPFSLNNPGGYTVVTSADLDNDGDLDILVNQYGSGASMKYYENTGSASTPSFAAPVSTPFGLPGTLYTGSMQFADMDGDNDYDLMSTNGSGVRYFQNIGTASSPAFAPESTNPFGLTNQPWNFRFEDMDNDGDLDMLGSGSGSQFLYAENTGTAYAPSFGPLMTTPFSLRTIFQGVSGMDVLDIDGDNDFDVIYNHSETGDWHFFENTGSASVPSFTDGHTNLFSLNIFSGSIVPSFGDLDGDGDLDILSEDNGNMMYYQNTGTVNAPNFAGPVNNPFGLLGYSGYYPVLVDMDGDGDLDIMANYGINFNYMENTGTANSPAFAAPQLASFSIPDTYGDIKADFADLDNDGDIDILAEIGIYGDVYYYENIGTSTAPNFGTTVVTNPFSLGNYTARKKPTIGDLDNDGDLDILFGQRSLVPGFTYYENVGTAANPTFAAPQENPFSLREVAWTGINQFDNFPSFVDLNGDGKLDLMAGPQYRGAVFFENVSACTVNTTVSQASNVLTANQSGAIAYQWLDCNNGNAPISGATGQTYTATANGSYACQITLLNCGDVTDCITVNTIGLSEESLKGIAIYPNPATTTLHIESTFPIESVLIFDARGNCVGQFNDSDLSVANLSNGIYFLSVKTSEGTIQSR